MVDDPVHPVPPAQKQQTSVLRLVRMGFFILITTVALVTVIQRFGDAAEERAPLIGASPRVESPAGEGEAAQRPVRGVPPPSLVAPGAEVAWWVPVAVAVGLFGAVLLVDLATPKKKISMISGVLFGLLAGVLATVAVSAIIELALRVWLSDAAFKAIQPVVLLIKPLLGIAFCYLGISMVLQTQDDFRLVIPYVEFAKQIRGIKPLILDTSALIDARIADVAGTSLIQAPIIIPRFVVSELQLLADSSDKLKRARGRRGLDVVTRLQRVGTIDVTIDETPITAMAVDQMLVELAQRMTGRIVTTDLGLTRVAQIHGVTVLNLHEIANAFKPALIPGEQLSVLLVKAGEQAGQAVGYLDDGTMVVAEMAAHRIGEEALLLVTSTLQTSAGRLIFAKMLEVSGEGNREQATGNREEMPRVGPGAEPPSAPSAPHSPGHAHPLAMEDETPAAARGASHDDPEHKAGGPLGPRQFGRRGPSPRNPRR